MEQALAAPASGPVRAMCGEILTEYRIACVDPGFSQWLAAGAPSADAEESADGAPAQRGQPDERRRE
jgi:hypothetical protein